MNQTVSNLLHQCLVLMGLSLNDGESVEQGEALLRSELPLTFSPSTWTVWAVLTVVSELLLDHLLIFVGILLLGVVLWLINRPFKRIRALEEVGYVKDGIHSLQTIAANSRRRRQVGNTPPPYPNGWYFVTYSTDLKKGDVRNIHLFNKQLVVFRGEDGKAAVLDAYCPHLGANLGIGGRVEGCAIRCPFHGWRFNSEGQCDNIPYTSQEIAKSAKVKAWQTLEVNSQVLIWFDAEGRDPYWTPTSYPHLQGQWKRAGITENVVNCHIQEIPENGSDLAHLSYLHSPFILNGADLRKNRSFLNIIYHGWKGKWHSFEEEEKKHMACLELAHELYLFGFRVPLLDFHVRAFQEGPALVYLTWKFVLGEGAFYQTLIPSEPMLLTVGHTVWMSRFLPNIIGRILMSLEVMQVDRDIMVWNNKKYESKPLLVKEEKSISQFRRWYSQFYSDHSGDFAQENNLEW